MQKRFHLILVVGLLGLLLAACGGSLEPTGTSQSQSKVDVTVLIQGPEYSYPAEGAIVTIGSTKATTDETGRASLAVNRSGNASIIVATLFDTVTDSINISGSETKKTVVVPIPEEITTERLKYVVFGHNDRSSRPTQNLRRDLGQEVQVAFGYELASDGFDRTDFENRVMTEFNKWSIDGVVRYVKTDSRDDANVLIRPFVEDKFCEVLAERCYDADGVKRELSNVSWIAVSFSGQGTLETPETAKRSMADYGGRFLGLGRIPYDPGVPVDGDTVMGGASNVTELDLLMLRVKMSLPKDILYENK